MAVEFSSDITAQVVIETLLGPVCIEVVPDGICSMHFWEKSGLSQGAGPTALEGCVQPSESPFLQEKMQNMAAEACGQLHGFLAGELRDFSLPLVLRGSPFQLRVWQALQHIGYGQTMSYASVAAAAGVPRAVRAVGTAIGKNPLAVIVPCHRVIRKDGSVGGYTGGLFRKKWLLRLEAGCGAASFSAES